MELSILIPAYNYTAGIERILNRAKELKNINKGKYEIIIYDNSENFRIYNIYKKYSYYLNIYYKKNSKFGGAVNNWNSLLKAAKGKFILMLHHDEIPEKKDFFKKLIAKVETYKNYDIFFFNCLLVNNNNIIIRPNFFSSLKKFIITYFPAYILRRNVVGSISNIVFKNKKILFDKRLVWFVDVDFYYRLIKKSKKFFFFNKDNMLSFYKYHYSISNKLTNKKLKKEKEYEILSFSVNYKFLKIYKIFFISIVESFIWLLLIFNLRVFYYLKNKIKNN
jgi:glycosyltransferase involved in cell wall biosynthesis